MMLAWGDSFISGNEKPLIILSFTEDLWGLQCKAKEYSSSGLILYIVPNESCFGFHKPVKHMRYIHSPLIQIQSFFQFTAQDIEAQRVPAPIPSLKSSQTLSRGLATRSAQGLWPWPWASCPDSHAAKITHTVLKFMLRSPVHVCFQSKIL